MRIIEAGGSKLWGAAFDSFIPVSSNPLSKVPRMTRLMPKRFMSLHFVRQCDLCRQETIELQDLQMLHRTRDRLTTQRTGLINHIRGLLGEYGVVMPVGAFDFEKISVMRSLMPSYLNWRRKTSKRSSPNSNCWTRASSQSTVSLLKSAGKTNGASAWQLCLVWDRWLPLL